MIIWFQRPPGETTISTTGLFNNPNYTGFSLSLIIPFILYSIIQSKNKSLRKIITIFVLVLTIYYIFLTQSRNAYIGLILSFSLTFGIKVIFVILILLMLLYPLNALIGINIQFDYIFLFIKRNLLEHQRLEIWQNALSLIKQRPLLGWGGATFGALYVLNNGLYKSQHSHNIMLQIAQSYGLPSSIIISSTIIILLIKSSRVAFDEKNRADSINKYWVISGVIIMVHQLFDIVLYEGRLNIIFCLIFAGCKSLIERGNKNEEISNSVI